MKRIGNLMNRIATFENVSRAVWLAARGKRQRPEVRFFLDRIEPETRSLVDDLQNGTLLFQKCRAFEIRDPKSRTIHAPPFRDRVAHHAIFSVAGPVLETGAVRQSYACRKGRGQHAAIRQIASRMRRHDWFLKVDIQKYYDSIPHDRLWARLQRRFSERRLLRLFDAMLASYEFSPGRGLPIGALSSQYLGNFHLDVVDHWILQRHRLQAFARYMDDFLLIGDRETLVAARQGLEWLLTGLGLKMKHGGVLNACHLGVPWLGFTLYPDRIRLNPAGRRRLRRRLRSVEREYCDGVLEESALQARATALFAHARVADDAGWRRTIIGFSRIGEAQGPATRDARRFLEQPGQELPVGVPQQEEARQPQQESGFPPGLGPRHDGSILPPPDDAPSRARPEEDRDETTGKPPRSAESPLRKERAKEDRGAPRGKETA